MRGRCPGNEMPGRERAVVLAAGAAAAGLAALRHCSETPTWLPAPLGLLPYAGAASAVGALIAAARGDRSAALIAAAGAAAIAGSLVPRVLPSAQPEAGGPLLTVMSSNLLLGRADPHALVAHVRTHAPDALMLQEQDPEFLAALDRAGIGGLLPHRLAGPGQRESDAALLSRWPLEPLGVELPRMAVGAVAMLPQGRRVPLIAAHPLAPAGRSKERCWRASMRALPAPAGALAGGVIAGDLNATLDHPELRRLLAAGWRDAGAEAGRGLVPTWRGFVAAMMTLDHVLMPPGAALLGYRVDGLCGSDHRTVTVRLILP